jgi:hypothetical protein
MIVQPIESEVNGTGYRSRPIRARRSSGDMAEIRDAIYAVTEEIKPATVRQIFYQLVSRGVIAKLESEYKQTVVRLLGDMRRDGTLPYDWIADNTRWMRKPITYSSLAGMLEHQQDFYRRALWDNQPAYVEIWLEKDALAGVLYPVTSKYDVPLMVTRGYPSLSYLHEAANTISEEGKPAYLYYFGDYDPSGMDITRAVENGIREMAPDAEIYFEREAVTPDQISSWSLPTRPTKATDTRSRNFAGESVEVDAIRPGILRELAEYCIRKHIDNSELRRMEMIQQAERETLAVVAATVPGIIEQRLARRPRA